MTDYVSGFLVLRVDVCYDRFRLFERKTKNDNFFSLNNKELIADPMIPETVDDFSVRSKIWIEDSRGKVIFGLGRYRILDAVRRTGSMQAAAKELHMSYRAVWMRVRSSEKRMGKELIVRAGKGSCLTPFAENLMKQYRRMLSVVRAETDEVYKNLITDHLN